MKEPFPHEAGLLPGRRTLFAGMLLCFFAAFALFAPSVGHGICEFDDYGFVFQNPDLKKGLSAEGISWAFQAGLTLPGSIVEYWMPLTVLTRLMDYQVSQLAPWWCHLVNVLLHSVNAALLFLALARLTGAWRRSLMVAMIFAIHPLQTEAVAWVSARRDLMGGLFWILGMLAYARYARLRTRGSYALLLGAFACGILSKPSVITFPAALLLLDFWPLKRFSRESAAKLFAEKLPLFMLALFGLLAAVLAQSDLGAFQPLERYPAWVRFANAVHSYSQYVLDFIAPWNLAPAYPHAGRAIDLTRVLFACSLLVPVTVAAWVLRRRFPWLLTGWFWFGGILVPMIQLTQLGDVSRADRYMYIPLVGLSFIAVWGVVEFAARHRTPGTGFSKARKRLAWTGALWLLALGGLAVRQVHLWGDSTRLWEYTLRSTPPNYIAQLCLGSARLRLSDLDGAERAYRGALAVNEHVPTAWSSLGRIAQRRENPRAASAYFLKATELDPGNLGFLAGLATNLEAAGYKQESMEVWAQALEMSPNWQLAAKNLERLRSK